MFAEGPEGCRVVLQGTGAGAGMVRRWYCGSGVAVQRTRSRAGMVLGNLAEGAGGTFFLDAGGGILVESMNTPFLNLGVVPHVHTMP